MITCAQIEAMITTSLGDAEVTVIDTTGTNDHFKAEVASAAFAGKSLIEQHKMVQGAVQAALNDGRIHAFSIKTKVKA